VLLEVLHLLEHRRAGRSQPARSTDDDAAVLAFCVRVDGADRKRHLLLIVGIRSFCKVRALRVGGMPPGCSLLALRAGSTETTGIGLPPVEGILMDTQVVLYSLNTEARTPT
jgi:hypothetical protein